MENLTEIGFSILCYRLIPTYLWGVITVEYSTSGFNTTFLTGIILGF